MARPLGATTAPHPSLEEAEVKARTVLAWVNCSTCGAYCDEKININGLTYVWCNRCYAKQSAARPASIKKLKAFLANGREPVDHYSAQVDQERFNKYRAEDETPQPKGKKYGFF